MMNLENLNHSYNRKVEYAILKEYDKIDDARLEYVSIRDQFKEEFNEKRILLKKEILGHKAQISIMSKERSNQITIVKTEFSNEYFELKENYKLDTKETKQIKKLTLSKIETNYHRILAEYDKACLDNNADALKKREEFKNAYKDYFQNQVISLEKTEADNLAELANTYNDKLSSLKNKRDTRIAKINEEFKQLSRKEVLKEDLTRTTTSEEKKKIKKEIKGLCKVKIEKTAHRKSIKLIKEQIASERKVKRENVKANVSKTLEAKNKYLAVRQESLLKIKETKASAKEYYKALPDNEKAKYRQYNKYVRQDFYNRRLQKLDKIEKKVFKNINPAYLYIFPAFFGALFFTLLPFAFMLITAFFRLDLATIANSRFVGINNFINIFTKDVEFKKALGNTAIYSFVTVVLLTIVTLSMAAWLSKNTKIHNVTQTMVFTPHIASLVSISILWIAMLHPQGIINQVLKIFGIEGPGWLIQENTSLIAVSFVTVWKDIGYYVLIIIAGLQAIPSYIYEAAKLDKSSKSNTFFKLTIPLLFPTLSFVFVTKFINSFKVFAPIEIMTNGGPLGSSMVLSYWIYKVGRIGYNYGFAMAGAIVLTIIIAICTSINYRFFNRKVTY